MMCGTRRFAAGRPVPPERLGTLTDSAAIAGQATALSQRLDRDGYLFLKGLLNPNNLGDARRKILERLGAVGEIEPPISDAVMSGDSRRPQDQKRAGSFVQDLAEMPSLRSVTHAGPLADLFAALFGAAARPFDFLWMRFTPPGRGSPLHFDHVYMNRGSDRVLTAWIPIGDVGAADGPLLVVEGSHTMPALHDRFRGLDVDRSPDRPGFLEEDALTFAERNDCRLLTADFRIGDVVIFGMFTLHGSFDNVSGENRVRLSCDARYQPAADPIDTRWFGKNPAAHGDLGYAGLAAARPLTAPAAMH